MSNQGYSMESFLKQVATSLIQKYGIEISQLTIVFPNRRAGVFFSDYLNSLVNKPVISPDIVTISELFSTISTYHVPERLNLIVRLFKVYKDITGTTETFDDFYYWGDMLISDFDQVDKYMINARDLFTNITELKKIDLHFSDNYFENSELFKNFWATISSDNMSHIQQEFVNLWGYLAEIYEKYRAILHSESLAYEGMLYRNAIDLITVNEASRVKDQLYAFVGFNALNRCEEVLFEVLSKSGNAIFFWDYDNYYLNDDDQEAGLFLRKNIRLFPQESSFPQSDLLQSRDSPKTLEIINITSQTGQAQIAGEKLSVLYQSDDQFKFDETALVLCDEELLLPVISAIPAQIENVNITMGYSLKLTPVFSLINQLTELHKNSRNVNGGPTYYNKDVLALLNNQLLIPLEPQLNSELCNHIMNENLVYVSSSLLVRNELYRLIFSQPKTIAEQPDYYLNILKKLFQYWERNESSENSVFYREIIFQAYLSVNNLKENILNAIPIIFEQKEFISAATFRRILLQYLGDVAIPFEGEPLKGLQVMGILETRALDFKNVIMLSVNDGIMPKISMSGSFIPYNLRRAFGLPTMEEHNAMYAYYFYRLLQRAENVTFIYNSSSDGLVTGEKSRYLYQLQMGSSIKISESTVSYKMAGVVSHSITINKNDEKVMALLNKYRDGSKVLTPTSLDKYLSCSLKFYFMCVAGLKEPEEIEEEVDEQIFGLLFHKAMENIYIADRDRMLYSETIDALINDTAFIESAILAAFRGVYLKDSGVREKIELQAKNRLIFEILKRYILQILSIDRRRAPFRIDGLEKNVSVQVSTERSFHNVSLGGIIDRIDRFNDYLQIIDYKTGKADLEYPLLSSLFEKENKTRNKAAFQTLVYCYILYKSNPAGKSIKPGIYDLRSIFNEDYDVYIKSKEDGNKPVDFINIVTQFEEHLMILLEEIFEPTIPFTQTTIAENCKYCPYRQICRR